MNEKLKQLLKRQTELVGKIAKGEANDEEKKQLDALNKKIEELSNPDAVDIGKTKLATMTLAEFKKHVEDENIDATAKLDTKRLALLKRNIDSVREQNKSAADDIVAVQVFADTEKRDERLDAVESKLDQIFELVKGATFDGRGNTGIVNTGDSDGEGDGEGEGNGENVQSDKSDDMPNTTMAATEALTAIIARYQKIKDMIEEGKDFTQEELNKMWPGWDLQSAVENAAAVLAKLEELNDLTTLIHPMFEKLAKGEGGEDESENNVEKGEKISKWAAGLDLASSDMDPKKQFEECKKASLAKF